MGELRARAPLTPTLSPGKARGEGAALGKIRGFAYLSPLPRLYRGRGLGEGALFAQALS
jgi:hypothetical protein